MLLFHLFFVILNLITAIRGCRRLLRGPSMSGRSRKFRIYKILFIRNNGGQKR